MTLSNTEEQLMEHLWKLEKAFLKELINCFPEPKPAITTVSTLIKRMIDKGFVGHKLYGNSRQYYPLITKSDYFAERVNGIISKNFNNSVMQFASFFTKATNLSSEQLEELRKIVDQEIKDKKNDNLSN